MKLLFIQNCISPHQMPYIEALSKRPDVEHVWVVAPRLAYSERAALGWPETWTTSSGKLSIVISPEDDQVTELFGQEECVCLFSGISAFPEVHHWLLLSLPYSLKRGIVTEAPYTYDKPLWMHRLRFALKDWRYVRYFDYVFAIGDDCVKYYRSWSKRWKVVPFMYCVEPQDLHERITTESHRLKVCFAGSLDRRKNVRELLSAVAILKSRDCSLSVSIVGNGPLRAELEQQAKAIASDDVEIRFLGALPMHETQKTIAEHDVLALPSLHDGWGAVINEAMTLGTVPVCSNRCGAKSVVSQSGYGGIYDVGKPEKLADILQGIANNMESVRNERKARIAWAKDHISPDAVATLMMQSLYTDQTI